LAMTSKPRKKMYISPFVPPLCSLENLHLHPPLLRVPTFHHSVISSLGISMADPPPLEQKRSIIAKGMIHPSKISGKSGGATPKFESKPEVEEVEDVIKSLPDHIYGTTEHVEPGFWASFVMQYRSEYQHLEWAQTAALRARKPIRELVLRTHFSGNEFFFRVATQKQVMLGPPEIGCNDASGRHHGRKALRQMSIRGMGRFLLASLWKASLAIIVQIVELPTAIVCAPFTP